MVEKELHAGSRQRIDKWLFFARMAKSRSIAQSLIQSNCIRINGALVSQPSYQVKTGDRLDIKLERRDVVLVVKSGGDRRGPFEEARLLYEDLTPPPAFEQAQRLPGSGRPTKKERRETERLFPEAGEN
jgi:ribosome-associated heat shock protein Hsp15